MHDVVISRAWPWITKCIRAHSKHTEENHDSKDSETGIARSQKEHRGIIRNVMPAMGRVVIHVYKLMKLLLKALPSQRLNILEH